MKHAYLNPPYAFGEERPWTSKVTTSPLRNGWNGAEWQNCKTSVISTAVIVGDNCSDRLVNTNTLDDLLIDVIMVGPAWNCPPGHEVGWVSSNPLRGITSEMDTEFCIRPQEAWPIDRQDSYFCTIDVKIFECITSRGRSFIKKCTLRCSDIENKYKHIGSTSQFS